MAVITNNRENTGKVGKGHPPIHTRFRQGVSGNPNGKKKGTKHRGTVLRELLDTAIKVKDLDGKEVKGTVEQKMLIALIKKAFDGDVQAVREALDSVYGKSQQNINTTGGVTIIHEICLQPGNDPLEGEDDDD